MEWLNERVESVPDANWLYKVICFLTFRWKKKMTYGELYLFLRDMNKNNKDSTITDKEAFKRIIKIYEWNNKRLPI